MKKVVTYFKNVKHQMSKVRWATKSEMFSDFWFILGVSVFLVAFFAGLDVLINYVL